MPRQAAEVLSEVKQILAMLKHGFVEDPSDTDFQEGYKACVDELLFTIAEIETAPLPISLDNSET